MNIYNRNRFYIFIDIRFKHITLPGVCHSFSTFTFTLSISDAIQNLRLTNKNNKIYLMIFMKFSGNIEDVLLPSKRHREGVSLYDTV